MSDNKLLAIMMIGFFAFAATTMILGPDSSDKEKEKTKQLMIQYKIDSLKNVNCKKDTIK
jgi:hypothetical protein